MNYRWYILILPGVSTPWLKINDTPVSLDLEGWVKWGRRQTPKEAGKDLQEYFLELLHDGHLLSSHPKISSASALILVPSLDHLLLSPGGTCTMVDSHGTNGWVVRSDCSQTVQPISHHSDWFRNGLYDVVWANEMQASICQGFLESMIPRSFEEPQAEKSSFLIDYNWRSRYPWELLAAILCPWGLPASSWRCGGRQRRESKKNLSRGALLN